MARRKNLSHHLKMIRYFQEPFRICFLLGIILLIWGTLIWVPILWIPGEYPVLAHRYLMLNGFTVSFIGGFLMTIVPNFSQTDKAHPIEFLSLLFAILIGIPPAYLKDSFAVSLISSTQAFLLLAFLCRRISKQKENPPYSIIFIFVGLFLWFISGVLGAFVDPEAFRVLHHEGGITAIILGVGSLLIPGILGHVEIVQAQRVASFKYLIPCFISSYLITENFGTAVRALVVGTIVLKYWRLHNLPRTRTALSWCIWWSGWLITLAFLAKVLAADAGIHMTHAFFICGIVLLCLLIATHVHQSHVPQSLNLETSPRLWFVLSLIALSAATRISAYYLPHLYETHLAYASLVLVSGVLIWTSTYLRFFRTFQER